jgi:superfamily I DNA and/or RNA helicase
MLPTIGSLVSDVFYRGHLEHGRGEEKVPAKLWPEFLQQQVVWFGTDQLGRHAHQRIQAGGNRSLSNPAEANAISDVLRRLDEHAPFIDWLIQERPEEPPIGIICTYAAQAQLIRDKLRAIGLSATLFNACRIGTVDSYQGKENLLVILSLVRNNEDGEASQGFNSIAPGFMARANRMNVALSRAMDRLVIVGALNRWPAGGVMDQVSKVFQSLRGTGLARLVELQAGEGQVAHDPNSKKKRGGLKRPKKEPAIDG